MRQFGLKLWSKDFIKNREFVASAEKALKEGKFDYLELFALPHTFDDTKDDALRQFGGVKTVIHAPHTIQNLDTANPDEFTNNQDRFRDSQRFADLLGAEIIILHPGMGTERVGFRESIRQFKAFNEPRIAVENLPSYCSKTKKELQGVTPLDIKEFIDETHCQFCLDFSHAICGANSCRRDIYEVLNEFKALKPNMYHLCDGDVKSTNDSHLHYGQGNYDLKRLIVDYTDEEAFITMETGSGIPSSVDLWIDDAKYLKSLIR